MPTEEFDDILDTLSDKRDMSFGSEQTRERRLIKMMTVGNDFISKMKFHYGIFITSWV